MAVTLENQHNPPPPEPATGQQTAPAPRTANRAGGEENPPGGGGDGQPAHQHGWPRTLAIPLIAGLAAALTYLGMLSQIWANLTGAQLPGA